MGTPVFSVEVITVPVSDIDRALRFYGDQVGFRLMWTIRRTKRSASSSSRPQAPAARFRSVRGLPTRLPVRFAMPILS